MYRTLAILALTALGVPAAMAQDGGSGAAAITAPLLLPDMPLHDPWIVADRDTQTYYLFTSNDKRMTGDPRLGIMAYTSRDLAHWTQPKLVFALPAGNWANAGGWAPEVHRWQGHWYLFATYYNNSLKLPPNGPLRPIRRSTTLAMSDRLDGPFTPVRDNAPIVEPSRMTLDGTLYVDPAGRPWLVYAHEWVQIADGAMEAIPLDDTLAQAGPPLTLFHASDARWPSGAHHKEGYTSYVTDGPEMFRTRTGTLLMLWSSYDRDGYAEGLARSRSGRIEGPWEQLPPLLGHGSGHGMLFHRFDGQLMFVVHRPFHNARGKLYPVRDLGDRIQLGKEATNLDGDRDPVQPYSR